MSSIVVALGRLATVLAVLDVGPETAFADLDVAAFRGARRGIRTLASFLAITSHGAIQADGEQIVVTVETAEKMLPIFTYGPKRPSPT